MKIYLNTAMFAAEFDYRWFAAKDSEVSEASKSILPVELLSLLRLENRSIVLTKSGQYLCLGLGGLTSIERKRFDFAGRKIRNSLLLVAENGAEQENCRQLALRALSSWADLERAIDLAFEEIRDPQRLIFHANNFETLLKESKSTTKIKSVDKSSGIVYPASEEAILKAIESLSNCDLTEFDNPILVYQTYETKEYFVENKVWIGISELEKSIVQFPLQSSLLNKNLVKAAFAVIVGIFLVSLFMLVLMLIFGSKTPDIFPPKKAQSSNEKNLPQIPKVQISILAKIVRFLKDLFSEEASLTNFIRSSLSKYLGIDVIILLMRESNSTSLNKQEKSYNPNATSK